MSHTPSLLMDRLRLTDGMSLGPGSKMEMALGTPECVGSSAHLGISDPTSGGHSAEQMFS